MNTPVALRVAERLASTSRAQLSGEAVETARRLFLDVVGLCVAARGESYIGATLSAVDRGGPCTAFGHTGGFDAFGAALVNGTAAHGEDFDDTFEGGPVHSGAVIVPAVVAVCEREGLSGERLLLGIVTGAELMCRLSLVAPMATHNAGFHPTGIFGALAAAGGVSAALGLSADRTASALGVAASMASGIIEYLTAGTWTKRMHAGWAAQSGIRAALMARGGFIGPATVLDGPNSLYRAFAPSVAPDYSPLLDDVGRRWVMASIAFKPYACGTMTQPFIDCARRLAEDGVRADDVREIVCQVAQGTVPRLWEPLAAKHRPPTPYAAKFSTPYCMAVGFLDGRAGFAQFTESRIQDPAVLALASKIRFEINPNDEYPRKFTGHLRAVLSDGTTREHRQSYMRGGVEAPLADEELETKCVDNAIYGGWTRERAEALIDASQTLFAQETLAGIGPMRG